MRLLNSKTLDLREFLWHEIPAYAILSHTWGDEEVTLQDMQQDLARNKAGYSKIEGCCEQAMLDGLEWVWIDTCCIDKTSSAELSEAINSMYQWYQDSHVCYVILMDVPPFGPSFPKDPFRHARWFTRGWCLQELIAPTNVTFYARDWTDIGTKRSLHSHIEEVTGIPSQLLLRRTKLDTYPVAQRMSWASLRQTARLEDEAYCLLGIFDIAMPLLYGEGERAFLRLQEEIMKRTEDYSLLLWTHTPRGSFDEFMSGYTKVGDVPPVEEGYGVFAPSPSLFSKHGPCARRVGRCNYGNIAIATLTHHASGSVRKEWNPPQLTSRGLRIQGYIATDTRREPSSASILFWTCCCFKNGYVCIILRPDNIKGVFRYSRSESSEVLLVNWEGFKAFRLEELYLNVDAHSRYNTLARGPLKLRNKTPSLKIILSTRRWGSISLVGSVPAHKFKLPTPCAQGEELSTFGFVPEAVISLRLTAPTNASGTANAFFTVDFGLKSVPWCAIRGHSAETVEAAFSDAEDIGQHKEYEKCNNRWSLKPYSDRAFHRFSRAGAVYVAAKAPGGQGPSTLEAYILHVTLLA